MTNLKNAFVAIMVMIALALVSCENETIDTVVEETSTSANTANTLELNTVQENGSMFARRSSNFGSPLATNVRHSRREVFDIPANTSYYVSVDRDRIPSIRFNVKNNSDAPINVQYYTGNILEKRGNISSSYGNLIVYRGKKMCYSDDLIVKITNYNSYTVHDVVWHANFTDGK